jgi:hypothetical protein
MRALRLTAALLLALAVCPAAQDSDPVSLTDFLWVPVRARQTPLQVDVSFTVIKGNNTVHAELIADEDFRPMQHGQSHDSLAITNTGGAGAFRRIIEEPGNYRVVIVNGSPAQPAMVRLNVSTEVNPAATTTELTPKRRLAVIGVSLLLFLGMLGYSGWKLKGAALD